MDPVITTMLIFVAALGSLMIITAFARQLLLSRDKKLNEEACSRGFSQNVQTLTYLRQQMQEMLSVQIHHEFRGENKEKVKELTEKIHTLLESKGRFIAAAIEKSMANPAADFAATQSMTAAQVESYDNELAKLQESRQSYMEADISTQKSLIAQEQEHNKKLDKMYNSHSALLAKMILSRVEYTKESNMQNNDANYSFFQGIFGAAFQLLRDFFGMNAKTGTTVAANVQQVQAEQSARSLVAQAERMLSPKALQSETTRYFYHQTAAIPEIISPRAPADAPTMIVSPISPSPTDVL